MHAMKSHRDANGMVSGYLVKTAQSLSMFQRKHFYRRYYELDLQKKQLQIYEKQGGALKDSMHCEVTHIVEELNAELRSDYQLFFNKGQQYSDISLNLPKDFGMPFAVFMADGSMILLWAANLNDLYTWTDAFRELKGDMPKHSKLIASPKSEEVPLPELSDFNYFVGTLYLCLLPEQFIRTDIQQLDKDLQLDSACAAAEGQISEVVVTENTI